MDSPKYVDVKGIKTRYFEAGQGEPMLLVHGGQFSFHGSAEDWDLNFDTFAQSYHTFSVDKIGMGFTDNPLSDEEYVMGASVQHLHDFMKAVGIDKAHLVGHSRGGYSVTRLALEHPEVVRTLIIVDSSTLMTPPNPLYGQWEKEGAQFSDLRENHRHQIRSNSFSAEHITDRFLDGVLDIVDLPAAKERVGKMASGLRGQFSQDLVTRQQETHEWIKAGGIEAPTLVIWAFNDPSATMERCGVPCMELIMSSVSNSQMHIINEAGHYVFREQPEAFVDAVNTFIQANS